MPSKLSFLPLCLPLSLLLSACGPQDPVWSVYCEDRPPEREVIPGTGEGQFVAADAAPLVVNYGPQGGSHIWVAVRLRNMGPDADIRFAIVDAEDPDTFYSGPIALHAELSYNPSEDASEVVGIFGYVDEGYDDETGEPLPGPSGRSVVLWADVTDNCTSEPVHGEATAQVE